MILSLLSSTEDRQTLLDNYIPVAFVKANAGNRIAITELDKRKLFGDYTLIPLGEEYQQKARQLAAGGGGPGGEPSFAREQLDEATQVDHHGLCQYDHRQSPGRHRIEPTQTKGFRRGSGTRSSIT